MVNAIFPVDWRPRHRAAREIDVELNRDGAQLFNAALNEQDLTVIEKALSMLPRDRPGVRIAELPSLQPALVSGGRIGSVAALFRGPGCRPVRAILFDKSEETNWTLGWHQDRTIAVNGKIEVQGFTPWTLKAGIQHVEPPVEILESMVTIRIHLDPVDQDNAPLLIAPGSHRLGRISEDRIDATVERCGTHACLADRGDVWAYSTLIVHSSAKAHRPRRRRVLQVDYSGADLPGGLQFYGVT